MTQKIMIDADALLNWINSVFNDYYHEFADASAVKYFNFAVINKVNELATPVTEPSDTIFDKEGWCDNSLEIFNHVKNKTWIIAVSEKLGVIPLFCTKDYGCYVLLYFSVDKSLRLGASYTLHDDMKDIIKWRPLPQVPVNK